MELALTELRLHQFRNFAQYRLDLPSPWCGVIGRNGAGKTNLLESLHVLCRLRGFRNEPLTRLGQWGTDEGAIVGQLCDTERVVRWDRDGARYEFDGDRIASQRQWVVGAPLFGYRPDDDMFFHEAPHERRRYLDWSCSYAESGYMATLARYDRTLRQRNAALRQAGMRDRELQSWEAELAACGAAVHQARAAIVARIAAAYAELWQQLQRPWSSLEYVPGGPGTANELQARLAADRAADAERGWTYAGPHRDDLVVRLRERPIKQSGSQGYRKLAVILLNVACAMVQAPPAADTRRLFYLDDIEGELDDTNERTLFDLLQSLPLQVLLTAVRRPPVLADRTAVHWIELAADVSMEP